MVYPLFWSWREEHLRILRYADSSSCHSGEGRNLENTERHSEQYTPRHPERSEGSSDNAEKPAPVIPNSRGVIPAKAGIHNYLNIPAFVINLDLGIRVEFGVWAGRGGRMKKISEKINLSPFLCVGGE